VGLHNICLIKNDFNHLIVCTYY